MVTTFLIRVDKHSPVGTNTQRTMTIENTQHQDDLPAISSTEPSPTCESNPATSHKPKRKKKKKATKTPSSDASPALPRRPGPDADRPPVLCISRNKHWKYISSYHVRPLLSHFLFHFISSLGSVAPTPPRVARVPPCPQPRPLGALPLENAHSPLSLPRARPCASTRHRQRPSHLLRPHTARPTPP